MKLRNWKFEGDILDILPERLHTIIERRMEADVIGITDLAEAAARRATKFKDVKGKVVTVPLYGYISHKPTIWSVVGAEVSSQTFGRWMDDLVASSDVGAIVIDVDSPGGTVNGLTGVSDKIYAMRGRKPIIAVANGMMASAAYFIGSSATEIVADPDSAVGSIGTIGTHLDWSGALEQAGVKATIISAGKYKSEGHPYASLSDEAKQQYQQMIDQYYEGFVSAVARNRDVTNSKVKADYGQGRVLTARDAKVVGMVDRVATLEQVISDLLPRGGSSSVARARLALAHMPNIN